MDRLLSKLLLLIIVLGIGIAYGISITRDGIESVNGPLGHTAGAAAGMQAETSVHEQADAEREPAITDMDEVSRLPETGPQVNPVRPNSDSMLSRIFHKTGSLIHLVADHLIRFVIGIGEALLS